MAHYTDLPPAALAEACARFGLPPPERVQPEPRGRVNTSYHLWIGGERWFLRLAEASDEAAARLFTSIQLRFLGMQRGRRGPLPRPIDPAELERLWSPQEKAGVQRMLAAAAVGSPAAVRAQLASLVEQTAADELIVACALHDHAARLRSYELLARL